MNKRVKNLWRLIGKHVDGILISSPENVRYLCGFSGTEGTLLLTRQEGFFLTDGRYTAQAKQQVRDFTPITFKEKWSELGRRIKKLHIKSLGFEARHLTVAFLKELEKQTASIEFKPLAEELDSFRSVKNATEIQLLKKAAAIAADSLAEVLGMIKPGVRELEVAAELEYHMRTKGGSDIAFQTIVASGWRSALPHGVASQKKIKKGDLVTIDYGVVYQGYNSDETCTFVVGKPTAKQKKIYTVVKKAHDLAITFLRAGKSLKDADAKARCHIVKMGYGKYFNHGTGHGVGLNVHETPIVSFRSKETAQKGMVVTIEPGIYLPKWGGVRIEDTVVVTQKGCELITQYDKNLQVIGM